MQHDNICKNKANFYKVTINTSSVITKDYEKKMRFQNLAKQSQTKPICVFDRGEH